MAPLRANPATLNLAAGPKHDCRRKLAVSQFGTPLSHPSSGAACGHSRERECGEISQAANGCGQVPEMQRIAAQIARTEDPRESMSA
jgi:hypothetical protein